MYPNQPQGLVPQQYNPAQYPPQAPQGYAQQPNQGFMQNPYGPTAVQAPVAQPAPPAMPAMPTAQSAAPVGLMRPAIRHLDGRLVAIMPKSGPVTVPRYKGKPGETSQEWTVDVVVLTGDTLEYGDNKETGTPTSHRTAAPTIFKTVKINSAAFDSHCASAGIGGMVLGWIGQTQGTNNTYWNLLPTSGTGAEEQQLAAWWESTWGGTKNVPEVEEFRPRAAAAQAQPIATGPVPVNPPYVPAQQHPQYPQGMQPAYQAGYPATAPMQPQYAPQQQAPQGWAQPIAPQVPQQAPGGYATPLMATPYAQPLPQQPAPVAQVAPSQVPPMDPATWASYSPEQQAHLQQQFAAHAGQPAGI